MNLFPDNLNMNRHNRTKLLSSILFYFFSLKNDLKFIQIDLPSNYVKKTDLDVQFNKIEISLQRILDKLDQKADK